ncbi:hypothetical protein RvY_18679 [Ramazzottius varieornatus]|uniref:Uncharacterized protein n=1 Tax=Ramazzottius varieornatus TaxID=947166 RepID=A0A1D1W6R4_RAMVA|nr:hypothetical protein RvY_18679 [Ramazzottius varieornatus]
MTSSKTKLVSYRPSSRASTDSGLGLSPHLAPTRRTSRLAQLRSFVSPDQFLKSLQESFIGLWHKSIPHDYIPSPDNLVTFASLWPDTTQVQAWILSQMVCTSSEQRQVINGFLEDVKLFAVRTGPPQLLTALHELGLLQPQQLLANKLTATESALLWKNVDALKTFGYDEAEKLLCSLNRDQIKVSDSVDEFARNDFLNFSYNAMPPDDMLLFAIVLQTAHIAKVHTENGMLLNIMQHIASSVFSKPVIDLSLCVAGANINAQSEATGVSPLHIASSLGQLDIVRLLLRRGANPNVQSKADELSEDVAPRELRRTVIQILQPYREKRLEDIIDCLMNQEIPPEILPADFDVFDSNGENLLSRLATENTLNELEYLIKLPFCPINAQDSKTGKTLLANSVAKGSSEVVVLLLKNGASPSIRDFSDLLPLHYAVDQNDIEMAKTMLNYSQWWTGLHGVMKCSRSAEMSRLLQQAFHKRQNEIVRPALAVGCTKDPSALNVLEKGDSINAKNVYGENSAFIAAKNGQTTALEILIQLGGDFWSKHAKTLETPLHVAASAGHAGTIKYLLKAAADTGRGLNINGLDANGKTPLHRAVEGQHVQVITMLLELGAASSGCFANGLLVGSEMDAVQAVLDRYRSPRTGQIFKAIENDDLRALKKVWNSKFDHYFRHSNGDTPIMSAARFGHVNILEYLLEDAEQEYRPIENDLNVDHDENVRSMIRRQRLRPRLSTMDLSPVSTETLTSDRRVDCYQWIFGSLTPGTNDVIPTIFLHEHRLNHVCAINLHDGCSALHRAIKSDDNVDVVRRLVNNDPYCVNIPEHNGFTPLHLAVILRRKRIIKYFCHLSDLDFTATDLLGRMPEELVDDMKTYDMIHNARTKPSSFWSTMCDEEIPLSTAEGLSSWTRQFTSVNLDSAADSVMGSSATISLFTGKTSASQDGLHEFLEKNFPVRSRKQTLSVARFQRDSKIRKISMKPALFDAVKY